MSTKKCDVAIIGGGPAGSTAGSLLKKYRPDLSVTILEREQFPREHVGESQLPPISAILQEIGAWDKIERAGFPIKIGATYRWGQTDQLWDFELFPAHLFKDEPRPARYEGQRTRTAFQVERSIYDEILLNHAAEMGCEVRQQTKVVEVQRENDRITGLRIGADETVEARWYIDASGHSGILRRAMGVPVEEPSALRNVAFWDYWDNASWAVNIGVGGTRVLVLSIGYGWIWFIPIGPRRASVGLVVPAEYYKKSGMRPRELYDKALQEDPLLRSLLKSARPDDDLKSTKDWSFVAQRMVGENWFLAGESAGFADPILAAGMTLAHAAARDAAYTILALDDGEHPAEWLRAQYHEHQDQRLRQHIRFADFWYTANGCFTDLKDYTTEIAKDAGLELDPDQAFQWLGTGGFIHESASVGLAGFPLGAVKDIVEMMVPGEAELEVVNHTHLTLNLDGAEFLPSAAYSGGKIVPVERWVRDGKSLPNVGMFGVLRRIVETNGSIEFVINNMVAAILQKGVASSPANAMEYGIAYLETMLRGGWLVGETRPGSPKLKYQLPKFASSVHTNRDMRVTAKAR